MELLKRKIVSYCSLIALLVLAGCQVAAPPPPVAQVPAPKPAGTPAVLFAPGYYGGCDYEFARWLVRDGFAVNSRNQSLGDAPLTWDEVKPYNVLVVPGIGMANADGTLTDNNRQNLEVINRFLQAGGGVLYFPSYSQMDRLIPPQKALLQPLGLTPLFEEMVFDHETPVIATPWQIPFAYSDAIRPSPITTGVKGLWLPVATRAGWEAHLVPFTADPSWDVVVTGGATSYTITVPWPAMAATKEMTKGRFEFQVPLVAQRAVGPGRLVVCGIDPQWLWGQWAGLTLEGVTRDRGLRGKPSDGYPMVLDSLRWLSAPSLATGALGGAQTSPSQLENPFVMKFCAPTDWTHLAQAPFPQAGKEWAGVIGARTSLSGGKGTVAEWVAQAKALGLGYLVFLEDFARLTEKDFDQLKADCAQFTTSEFAAIPGFRIQDEIGNNYFYTSPKLLYPPKYLLSDNGKVFIGYDAQIGLKDPRTAKGQLAATTLTYTYVLQAFKLLAGNYLFNRETVPVANWFSDYDSVGVITRQGGREVQDATADYLQLVAAGQAPLPVVVDLLDDPAQLAQTPWRTVLPMTSSDTIVPGCYGDSGKLDGVNPVAAYFSQWHFWPDNPTRIYVTAGPQIDYWSLVGPRNYEFNNRGDFVWQNYRWRVGGKVRSTAGLRAVAVYDGARLVRRFAPGGAKEFAFTLDLTHNQQHNLVLLVTDQAGHRALSVEQCDWNHRLEEYNCADRHNQLTCGYNTRTKDDTSIQLGGQAFATPDKRVPGQWMFPAGMFKNDPFLGAPAFDGAAYGDPSVVTPVLTSCDTKDGRKIIGPPVADSRRLMCSGDVNIGETRNEYRFADNVDTLNVWHTLWRPVASSDIVTSLRCYLFQVDPDSPLAVTLWHERVGLRADLPIQTATVGAISLGQSQLWAVCGSDGTALSGTREETSLSQPHSEELPFGFGAYAAALGSPMGGCAVFSLTDGLNFTWSTPKTDVLYLRLPAAMAPQKKDESWEFDLLVLGIPRSTKYTQMFLQRTTQVVERFRRDFGLSAAGPSYRVKLTAGTITSQRYLLRVDGADAQAFSGVIDGDLISSLPIVVSGLNDKWSAFLYDRHRLAARPIGMFENQAWATVRVHGPQDLFVGHPVTCDNPAVGLQLTQTGDHQWHLEVHNPADAPVTVALRFNPYFDPWTGKSLPREPVTVPGGGSRFLDW